MRNFIIGILTFFFFLLSSVYLTTFFLPQIVPNVVPVVVPVKYYSLPQNYLFNKKTEKPVKILADPYSIQEKLILNEENFLEVNLQEMKIKIYQDGLFKNELPIFKKGDPQEWGGTAAGLYQVTSKYRLSYSAASEVYMPYAVKFYGKYYLHGEPYYPGGAKLISEVSGGCIRLLDKDAKYIYNITEKGTPILVIDKKNDGYKYSQQKINEFPEISAKSYLIADLDSGFVFEEKNPEEKLPIASLTKLMTAVVITENIDLKKSIVVRKSMLEPYGSTAGLESGKRFGIVELFYPLLVESSNDAAEVLSYFLGKEKTIKLMNEKAKSILMPETIFVDTHGFGPNNISTAQDLFYLARYILNNRTPIWRISKGEAVPFFGRGSFGDLKNKNFFSEDPNLIGGKTGHIVASGYNGLFVFRFVTKEGIERRIAIIILRSEGLEKGIESLKKDTQEIINWLKENYFKEN